MSWNLRKVALLTYADDMGDLPGLPAGTAAIVGNHLIGWIDERDCGCRAARGLRLDVGHLHEDTFTVISCDAHHDAATRAFATFQTMPPSDRDVFELYEELLEAEIVGVRMPA